MILARKAVDPQRRAEIGRERRARTRAKIIAAAFELFGTESGLYTRIEDISDAAGITRATFYNHFSGLDELRDALSYEVTHDFLTAVTQTLAQLPDPRDRAAVAIRLYLERARSDHQWAWSMLNMSANGIIFGAETYRQAAVTVSEGIEAGVFSVPSVQLGRDILLGATLAAMGAMLREDLPENYPESVAGFILLGIGVPRDIAHQCAHAAMPRLLFSSDLLPAHKALNHGAGPAKIQS